MLECPKSSCTTRRSAPPRTSATAYVCRSLWGDTKWLIPAFLRQVSTICPIDWRLSAPPRAPKNTAEDGFLTSLGRASVKYRSIHGIVWRGTGTTRDLPPFPVTRNIAESKSSSSIRKPTTSLTRSPVPKINSIRVRSRTPTAVLRSGASNKAPSSSVLKALGTRLGSLIPATLGKSAVGPSPFCLRNLSNERRLLIRLRAVLALTPRQAWVW